MWTRIFRGARLRNGGGAAGGAVLWMVAMSAAGSVFAGEYQIQPGDVLTISVWREPELQVDAVVRPDGFIAVPLIGDVEAHGRSVPSLRNDITERMRKFIPDASVNVATKQLLGNKIYVLGKVNRPGEYLLNRDVDVIQALSMAMGTAKFAATDRILILRRGPQGQEAVPFNLDEVQDGEALEQNIVLRSGDVVVVP